MDATCLVCSAEGRFHAAGALGAAFINDAANWPWLRTSGYLAAGRGVVRVVAAEALGFAISCFLSAWRLPAALSRQHVEGPDLAETFGNGAFCLCARQLRTFSRRRIRALGPVGMFRARAGVCLPRVNSTSLMFAASQAGFRLHLPQLRAEYILAFAGVPRLARSTRAQHLTGCFVQPLVLARTSS